MADEPVDDALPPAKANGISPAAMLIEDLSDWEETAPVLSIVIPV